MHSKHHKKDREFTFDLIVTILLCIFGILTLYPLLFVLSASISDPTAVNSGQIILLPEGIQFEGYTMIFKSKWIPIGYRNSLIYTFFGTTFNIAVTFMAAYALSRPNLYGRKFITIFMVIPMWFGGGLIPTFIVTQKLGLINSPLVMIIMGLFSMYNCIICRTFIKTNIPEEMIEASKIEGCTDFAILLRIVLPLSGSILAIISLFYGLGHWNDYFTALIYLNDKKYQTLQLFLRDILIQNESVTTSAGQGNLEVMIQRAHIAQVMKYSLIVVASLPMLIIYPFLQRYFVKGIMIGAIKG